MKVSTYGSSSTSAPFLSSCLAGQGADGAEDEGVHRPAVIQGVRAAERVRSEAWQADARVRELVEDGERLFDGSPAPRRVSSDQLPIGTRRT